MDDDGRKALSIRITGRVQGVGFRAWTRDEATGLGLDGWVRNEPDGSVSALVAGPPAAVSDLLARLHVGPPGSRVARVEAAPAVGDVAPGFRIAR